MDGVHVHAIVLLGPQSKRRDMRPVSTHKCLSLDFSETMDGVHAIVVLGPQFKRRAGSRDGGDLSDRAEAKHRANQVRKTGIKETHILNSKLNFHPYSRLYVSLVVRKPAFCIGENKDADQLRGNREADQRLCFRYTDSTIPLLS